MSEIVAKNNTFHFPICGKCIHDNGDGTCKAFPEGIPDEFFFEDSKHTNIVEGQKGKFVFEKKE